MVLPCFKFSCKLPPVSLRCSRTCQLFLTDVYNCQRRRLPPVVMPKFELKNIGSRVRREHCSTTELHSVLVTVIIDFFLLLFQQMVLFTGRYFSWRFSPLTVGRDTEQKGMDMLPFPTNQVRRTAYPGKQET